MDQIIKIYEELIQYDASLSKDKASVLQLIKKMVAAKPNVEVNTQWKNAFSQRLTEHIANAKPLNSASYSGRWYAKWATSLFGLFVVMTVSGLAYWKLYIAHPTVLEIKDQKSVASDELAVRSYERKESSGYNAEIKNQKLESNNVETQYLVSVKEEREMAKEEHTQLSTSVIDGNQQVVTHDKLTQVDTLPEMSNDAQAARYGVVSGGEEAPMMMAKNALENSIQEQKVAAFIVVDMTGGIHTGLTDLIYTYHLPVTYANSSAAWEEKNLSGTIYFVTEKNSEYILSSLSNRSILVWDMGFIDEHISYFEKIISSLQERGYVFLTLSSMQQ